MEGKFRYPFPDKVCELGGVVLVGNARGLRTTNWGGKWRVTGKWSTLRYNCVLVGV